jgi:hypothetical protein
VVKVPADQFREFGVFVTIGLDPPLSGFSGHWRYPRDIAAFHAFCCLLKADPAQCLRGPVQRLASCNQLLLGGSIDLMIKNVRREVFRHADEAVNARHEFCWLRPDVIKQKKKHLFAREQRQVSANVVNVETFLDKNGFLLDFFLEGKLRIFREMPA